MASPQNGPAALQGPSTQAALADPMAEAQNTNHAEPAVAEPKPIYDPSSSSGSSAADPDEKSHEKELEHSSIKGIEGDRPRAYRTVTTATEQSAVSLNAAQKAQKVRDALPWYRKYNPLRWGPIPELPKDRVVSREYNANFFSKLTFHWMGPLMSAGYQRPLEVEDIWAVNPDRASDLMVTKLQSKFRQRVDSGSSEPLLMAMYDTFKFEFVLGGVCQLMSTIFQVMSPYTLRYLIQFVTDTYIAHQEGRPAPPISHGIGLVIGIFCMQVFQSTGTNHFIYRGMMVGGQSRAALIAAILEKSMKLSGRARAGGSIGAEQERLKSLQAEKREKRGFMKKFFVKHIFKSKKSHNASPEQGWSNGRIVNLMSTDTYRIDQASGLFHMLWTSPIAIILSLILLLVNLSYPALAGFGLLVVGVPLLTRAVKSLIVRRKALNKITDARVSLTQEILQSVRFVKYFGWESSFTGRLGELRKKEINGVQMILTIRNALLSVSLALPTLASMLAFITYKSVFTGFIQSTVFSSLALFNALRMPLNLLPMVIGQVTDAADSISRIQEFLLAEEQGDVVEWDSNLSNAIEVTNGSFAWERTSEKEKVQTKGKAATKQPNNAKSEADAAVAETEIEPFKLTDINLSVGRNELIAVIGTVGSGKSSLLSALAGDMRQVDGHIKMSSARAFCPQYAWIQNATVKDNILFGKEMDRQWYNEVVDACALRADLDMLPGGEMTEIGERGITVSGGQKQRMNIARAIYFDSDIILMDDPLSAVDAHVGRHIFDNAICGLLKDKCRVLATHQLHVLHRCDRIVWLEEGRIVAVDTFDNLMANSHDFQKMMATTAQEEKEEVEDDDDEDELEGKKKIEDVKKQVQKVEQKKKTRQAALMQKEDRAVNSVSFAVYAAYIKAAGGYWIVPVMALLLIMSQGAQIVTSLWLSFWTSDKYRQLSDQQYIGVYVGLAISQAFLMFAFTVSLAVFGTNASRILLQNAMYRVLRAPMQFFDTTPLGRITNRFAKDVDTMDNALTDAIRMFAMTFANIIAVFILIIAYYYIFAAVLVPLTIMFIFSANFYRSSAREMKRHEAVLRSDVFAKFSEIVSGISSIRAYGLEKHFNTVFRRSLDNMDSAYFLTYANQRWLGVRIDAIGNLMVLVVGILVVTNTFHVQPATAGLVLSYILSIVQLMQFTIRQLAEVENAMNATERIQYYATSLDEEAPLKLKPVDPSWPPKGEIVFDNVQMRYRDGLPLVLKGFDMRVRSGERIGIVGRTGAGKSSIMSTLFRLVELSGGKIRIDGENIAEVGLQDLRNGLAIIPQDPTLFKGTIRSNLDPFSQHTDLELWAALRQAGLIDSTGPQTSIDKSTNALTEKAAPEEDAASGASSGRIHLDSVVEEEGLNFSLGQRQLMALARALVRGSQIIVCDEATSSVDMETDQKIQRTIATAFRGKTLLCIAHRLKTIIGYDRICVMDAGQIAELDTPIALWERGGIFRSMCERSGIRREDFAEMMTEFGTDGRSFD